MVHPHGFRLCVVSGPHTMENPDEEAYQVRSMGNHECGHAVCDVRSRQFPLITPKVKTDMLVLLELQYVASSN